MCLVREGAYQRRGEAVSEQEMPMSTERESRLKNVSLTTFFGGKDKGRCLQLTSPYGKSYIQVDRHEARLLIMDLIDYLDDALKETP